MTSSNDELCDIKNITRYITSFMVLPLFFLFWVIDLFYAPDHAWLFLIMRCVVIPVAIVVGVVIRNTDSIITAKRMLMLYASVCAGVLSAMVYVAGPNALYYNGLHLVAIGALGFIPFDARYFYYTAAAIYLPYYAVDAPRLTNEEQFIEMGFTSLIGLSVVCISWVMRSFQQRFRQKERALRLQLEEEIEKNKRAELQLVQTRDLALQAAAAKSAFLANMSHEIRTPLTAIIGYGECLVDPLLSTHDKAKSANTVVSAGKHLLHLINDILDISKIEAGKLEIERALVSPCKILSETESVIGVLAREKKLQLHLYYEFPLPATITTDHVRLKQILFNLCNNAIKFTHCGQVKVITSCEFDKRLLRIKVIDSGIGITPDQQATIFDTFTQADASTTRQYGGTGLGLSISKSLAEILGGNLTCSSVVGVGSCFELTVHTGDLNGIKMYTSIEQVRAIDSDENKVFEIPSHLAGRVLLAEDNLDNQYLIANYIKRTGAQVICVENGKQAVINALNNHFDLIFMDMQMPEMDGVDAVKQLRQSGCVTTVIMLTANTSSEDELRCESAGANGFLTKPLIKPLFFEALRTYLPVSTRRSASFDDDGIGDLIDKFISQLPDRVRFIESVVHNSDWETALRAAHNLKGTGGNYGYPQLSSLAQSLERSILDKKNDEIYLNLTYLKTLCSRIVDEHNSAAEGSNYETCKL